MPDWAQVLVLGTALVILGVAVLRVVYVLVHWNDHK